MTTSEGFYSRLVVWLKILLPLVALGILSTVFFLARSPEVDPQLPYATSGGVPLTADDMIADPRFVGVGSDGAAISLSARSMMLAVDGQPGQLLADQISSTVESPSGRTVESNAETGRVDTESQIAEFVGAVDLVTSDGFTLSARDVRTRMNRLDIASQKRVEAKTPLGDLEAGGFLITADEDGDYVLVFNSGVKLVYAPKKSGDQ